MVKRILDKGTKKAHPTNGLEDGGVPPSAQATTTYCQVTETSGSPLVLIVDDNEDDRLMLSRALRHTGMRVAEAVTGDEALQVFQERKPQAVLLDFFMPGMGGLGICRLLRSQTGGERLPIIVLSGLDDTDARRSAQNAGASDFLAKPNVGSIMDDCAALAERVRHLLGGQHGTQDS